jgi:hypothetical protein
MEDGMKWTPAVIDGQIYDLSHLHPFSFTLALAERGAQPPITFEINVNFGLHCFTDALTPASLPQHHYTDTKETRCFSHDRYVRSQYLPNIIKTLHQRRCYVAKKNNYMTFEIKTVSGTPIHYQVYFIVTKSRIAGQLTLYVQSAYQKDVPKKVQREKPRLFKTICVEVAT